MKKVSLLTLWKLNKEKNQPFFGDSNFLSQFDFMTEYLMDHERIDRNFAKQRGFFCPVWNLDMETSNEDVLAAFRQDIEDILMRNEENFKRLYAINKLEYNPIHNYDRTEHIVDVHSGNDKTTDNFGKLIETNDLGAINTTNNYGEVATEDTVGEHTNTSNNGVYGFNSPTDVDSDKRTDTIGATTGNHTENARSDSSNTAARSDSHNIEAREDSHDLVYGHTITHDNNTSGNIGVTTTQQMAESEVNFWNNIYNFYNIIEDEIIRKLCVFYDDAPEPFQRFYEGGCIDVI